MPLGSSSAAPVISPGPSLSRIDSESGVAAGRVIVMLYQRLNRRALAQHSLAKARVNNTGSRSAEVSVTKEPPGRLSTYAMQSRINRANIAEGVRPHQCELARDGRQDNSKISGRPLL